MAKVSKAEYDKQLAQLREWIKPGDTVYTILEHVSRSGMSRTIKVVVPYTRREAWFPDGYHKEIEPGVVACTDTDHGGQAEIRTLIDHLHPNYAVSVVCGYPLDKARGRDGVKVGGAGRDMGFALVSHLGQKLYGGKRCDHAISQDKYYDLPISEREEWRYLYVPQCDQCKGTGNVIGTGYQCPGKGKCPSNYHTNHRDHVDCPGEGGERCYTPRAWRREEIPADWPEITLIPADADGEAVTQLAACLTDADGRPVKVCPTCEGRGSVPNPDGPERFDLEHFDSYAIRHRWL